MDALGGFAVLHVSELKPMHRRIFETKQIGGLPIFDLAIEGVSELRARDLAIAGCFPVGWDDEAIWCEIDGVPVGLIAFQHQRWLRSVYITLSYVKSEHRRRGIWEEMYERLRTRAIELDCRRISGTVSANNRAIEAAALSVGRKLVAHVYEEMLVR